MKDFKKTLAVILAFVLCISLFAGCATNTTDDPEATEEPTAEPTAEPDAEVTTDYVAKVGDLPVYSCEFYYFLYSGLRTVYYRSEGVYDENLTDDENYQRMVDYFYSTKEDGTTYLDEAIQETLDIAISFKIAEALGRETAANDSSYAIDDDYLTEILGYVDSEADYGASVYDCTRDEYFFYAYGMNVNDAKRYTESQLYTSVLESYWCDQNGYTFSETEPTAPDDDADQTTIDTYNAELEAYNAKKAEFYEQFREYYNDNKSVFDIKTLRFLFLSTEDLSDDEKAEKETLADKLISLANDGMNFENLVKGYSEDSYASSTGGLTDIDLYDDTEYDVPTDIVNWAIEQDSLTGEIVKFETDEGIYIVRLEGIVDFDGINGTLYDTSTYTADTPKDNAKYAMLSEKYNDYLTEQAELERFAVTEKDTEAMQKLAKEYLEYDTSAFES